MLELFLPNFEEYFGKDKECYLVFNWVKPVRLTITAGDLYVDPNEY